MMGAFSLAELAAEFDWSLHGADVEVLNVSTDSRNIGAGDLFVALRGEHFDGHDFAASVADSGAAGLLVDTVIETDLPQLVCANTNVGLGQLAKFNRQRFKNPLIALTGSAGKTTVKSMIAHVLSQSAPTLATEGNFNNEIGVPLTALRIAPQHHYAVVEMGAARTADIAYLCRWAQPDVALVTNVGRAHVESFGSVTQTASAKGEIFEALAGNGTAIINADSEYFDIWNRQAGAASVISFGLSEQADVCATNVLSTVGNVSFVIRYGAEHVELSLAVPGCHNAMNALAAVACCLAVGLSLTEISAALASFQSPDSRLVNEVSNQGATIINDTYNANPEAFKAAIDVLAQANDVSILVMGDMAELGEQAESAHAEVGAYARTAGVRKLFATGALSATAVNEFGADGMWFSSKQELIVGLQAELTEQHTALIKGSRSAGMEQVVAALIDNNKSENGAQC